MRVRHCARACSGIALVAATILAASACAPRDAPTTGDEAATRLIDERPITFETSVAPRADEDLAQACTYELTLPSPARTVRGVWTIFERSRETLAYYQDADVRAFARRHDIALLFPRHCPSKSQTGGT